jgi:hypothetical protein
MKIQIDIATKVVSLIGFLLATRMLLQPGRQKVSLSDDAELVYDGEDSAKAAPECPVFCTS